MDYHTACDTGAKELFVDVSPPTTTTTEKKNVVDCVVLSFETKRHHGIKGESNRDSHTNIHNT